MITDLQYFVEFEDSDIENVIKFKCPICNKYNYFKIKQSTNFVKTVTSKDIPELNKDAKIQSGANIYFDTIFNCEHFRAIGENKKYSFMAKFAKIWYTSEVE